MESRSREGRRGGSSNSSSILASNGFNRRRHRTTNTLRDSPDEDGGVEFHESVRLRERVKKDRDRDRERDLRERDLRERSNRSKRRRGERLTRDDITGDETSDESINDDEEYDSLLPPPAAVGGGGTISHHHQGHVSNHQHHHHHSHSFSQQQQQQQNNNNNGNISTSSNIVSSSSGNINHHLQHRKTFPPATTSSSSSRAPPVWKPGDEMISLSVPRKARSASTKRSHDWISSNSNNSGGGVSGGDQNLRPPSSSPVRQGHVSTPPTAPMSPSSSNASLRKKLKHSVNNNSGAKLKPPKVSSTSSSGKPNSSNPEELEIEIAEVLYGLMTQSQVPPSSSSSKKEDSREVNNRLNADVKSHNSSPISNSTSNNNPTLGPSSTPFSAVAPKRKRPRQIPENSSYGARAKPETDQTAKSETASPNLEKISAENGCETGGNLVNSLGQQPAEPPVPAAPESGKLDSELMKPLAEELREIRDLVAKEDLSSSKEQESPAVRAQDSSSRDLPPIATAASSAGSVIKANLMVSEMESQKEEKLEIDLMAPPPQVRSSPEREIKTDLRASSVDQKPVLSIVDAELKPVVSKDNEDDKGKNRNVKDHLSNLAAEEKKCKESTGEGESNTGIEVMCRSIDLQLDLERPERNGNAGDNINRNKSELQNQKQQMPLKATREEPPTEKSGHLTSSLPLPMSMASWPGGLSPMGYMAPLQGVVSMEGGNVTPAHPLFSQPRPKRCATHCHIARNIHCLQQFMKMNPFWPPPAGAQSLFGSKPCNLNVMPTADLNINVRGVNNAQDKGQSLASNSNHGGKEKGSQPATTSDSSQRKQQILIQQALPPVAPSNLLGPTFIFPLNQQQAAMAARPGGATKSPTTGPSSTTASSGSISATSAAAATAMSFNYPNIAANETQYLAILQNNAYPFPMPPNYRGPPPQAMPLFNGSFYPSQIIHQQLQQPPPSNHSPQLSQAHQNASASSNSSSSQKHLHSQQPRPQNSPSASLQNNFSSQKAQPSQQLQYSNSNQYMQGSEESPSATDNRGPRASVNIYGQNFAMPIHPQNFAIMTQNSNQMEKKSHQTQQQQQQQQQGLKSGVDSLPPHSFAMSFGPGIDASSMAQTHAMFQNSQEAARQNMQMMAAAAVAAQVAQKKNFRISEEGKSGNADSSAKEDERKSFAFTRPDMTDSPMTSSIQANSVIESSARPLGPSRNSRPATTSGMGTMNVPNAHVQAQLQQQQMLQLKQQQQQMAAANAVNNRSKGPTTSNGNIYSEHSSSMKFQNALSPFPQNLVQSNSTSPAQSPQWKSSARMTPTSQAPSSLGPSTAQPHKNLPQQHSRTQPPMHTQILFGGNQKQPGTASQGQAPPSSNQAPSSPMMVGSPTTSSISKGTGGSPRTTSSASTHNKPGQASPFSAQLSKNPSSMPNKKSPSILGNPHTTSSSGSGAKSQMHQQAQNKNIHQAQLFFSSPYSQSQSQSPHSMSTSSSPSGYYMAAQRRPDQHLRPPGGPLTSSSGVLSLCPPVSMSGTGTNDPATAIAAATCNVKGGGLTSQGMIQASPFGAQPTGILLPAGFSYVHPVPAAVQVKPAEQKQPAGNDSLHQWQPEKK